MNLLNWGRGPKGVQICLPYGYIILLAPQIPVSPGCHKTTGAQGLTSKSDTMTLDIEFQGGRSLLQFGCAAQIWVLVYCFLP